MKVMLISDLVDRATDRRSEQASNTMIISLLQTSAQ